MKKILKSQSGMTLIEIIIAGSIMVGIGLATMKITENANKSMKKVEFDAELKDFRNYIMSALSKNDNCKNTFTAHLNSDYDMKNPTVPDDGITPLTQSDSVPERKFHKIDTGNFKISLRTNPASVPTPNATDRELVIPLGGDIPGFPNWKVTEIGIYEVVNAVANSGTCQVRFDVEKQDLSSERSFGAKNKVLWFNLNCTHQTSSPNIMQSCGPQNLIEVGFWKLVDSNNLNGPIKPENNQEIQVEDIVISGALSVESDIRLKNSLTKIQSASEKIQKLNGFYYFMNQKDFPEKNYDNRRHIGLIAQEVESVFPEAVSISQETGLKRVSYIMLIPVLLEALKEQQTILKVQERKIQDLENTLKNITAH